MDLKRPSFWLILAALSCGGAFAAAETASCGPRKSDDGIRQLLQEIKTTCAQLAGTVKDKVATVDAEAVRALYEKAPSAVQDLQVNLNDGSADDKDPDGSGTGRQPYKQKVGQKITGLRSQADGPRSKLQAADQTLQELLKSGKLTQLQQKIDHAKELIDYAKTCDAEAGSGSGAGTPVDPTTQKYMDSYSKAVDGVRTDGTTRDGGLEEDWRSVSSAFCRFRSDLGDQVSGSGENASCGNQNGGSGARIKDFNENSQALLPTRGTTDKFMPFGVDDSQDSFLGQLKKMDTSLKLPGQEGKQSFTQAGSDVGSAWDKYHKGENLFFGDKGYSGAAEQAVAEIQKVCGNVQQGATASGQ